MTREEAIVEMEKLGMKVSAVTPIFEKADAGATNEERLANALESLPVPAAFRDATIALRKIRKETCDPNCEYLKMIYTLAVWESFYENGYSKVAKCPTFNILLLAFDEVRKLPCDWNTFGYKHLSLYDSDIKAMIAAWGEPKRHSTLKKDYKNMYREYERRVRDEIIL